MQSFQFGEPKILGIVNITEDSFSDGGLYLDPEKAIAHALRLFADGADIIDLGASSSNPNSKPVAPDEEKKRLAPILRQLKDRGIPVSVDAFHPETQRFALAGKVAYLNDIQGFPNPEIYAELAASECKLIVMHSVQRLGKAQIVETDPQTIVRSILEFFAQRLAALESAGVQRERVILDPGMGFFLGKAPEPSVEVLRNLSNLRTEFKLPVLVSVSRKSFLRNLTGRTADKAGPATLAAELYAALEGVDYIRTHEARQLKDALKIFKILSSKT